MISMMRDYIIDVAFTSDSNNQVILCGMSGGNKDEELGRWSPSVGV